MIYKIDAVSLVYAMQYAGTDQLCAIPSWKVDYVLKNADEIQKSETLDHYGLMQ